METSPVSVLLNEHDVAIKLHSGYAGLHQWMHTVFGTGQRSSPSGGYCRDTGQRNENKRLLSVHS